MAYRTANLARHGFLHALGFGILAPVIGRLAEDLCAPLLRPSPQNQAASDTVKIIDIDLYMADGQPAACPALRELATETVAGVIGTLLTSHPSPQKGEIGHIPPGDVLPSQQKWAVVGEPRGQIAGVSPGRSSEQKWAVIGEPCGQIAGLSPGRSSDLRILMGRIMARGVTESSYTQPAGKPDPA